MAIPCLSNQSPGRRPGRGKRVAFFLSLFMFIVPVRDVIPAPAESLPWQRVEELLDSRSFVSGDGLFQLLYTLYTRDQDGAFRLDRHVLARLQGKIATLFPLAGCEAIEVQGRRIVFQFAKPQQVTVPNTWRQASLHLSDRLVLAVVDQPPAPDAAEDTGERDPATRSICFHVQEGTIQLHFSLLLGWVGGRMRDAEGTDLRYQINEAKRISRLQLLENTPLGGDRLKISRPTPEGKDRGMLWIDIDHPDFPGNRDIGIGDAVITFLGTEVELMPDGMIRIGRQEPARNDQAWHWFTSNIAAFRDYAKTGRLSTIINYTRFFDYRFEERQVAITLGFHAAE